MHIKFVYPSIVLKYYDSSFIWYQFQLSGIVGRWDIGYVLRTPTDCFNIFSLISDTFINIHDNAN